MNDQQTTQIRVAKIREALEWAKRNLWTRVSDHLIDEALAALDAPPIVGELTEEEIERITLKECPSIAHLPQGDHLPHLHGFQRGLRYARDHGYLAQAPQSSPATVARVYTERSAGKWHAGLNIGNQSFTLHANEGTKEEANWFAEMLSKALAQSSPSVIEAGDAMENMMRRLRTQRDDDGILPTGNDFNGMDGLCAAWVAAKASRPSVTAPQGVTVDQILEVVNDWRANMHLIEVPPNTPYSTGVQNVLRSRLTSLLTK
jgi:hypothetical protein